MISPSVVYPSILDHTDLIRLFMKYSWLFLLNFLVFQWSGYRLARIIDDESSQQIGWTWAKFKPMQGWHF